MTDYIGDMYSIDLARSGIEYVDVEIRDVIAAINELPFARTLYSCAGFGRAGLARRNHKDHPAGDPTGHAPGQTGYVVVEYDANADLQLVQRAHCALHDAFDGTDFCRPMRDEITIWRFSYRINRSRRNDVDASMSHDEYMRSAWDRVLEAVARVAQSLDPRHRVQ